MNPALITSVAAIAQPLALAALVVVVLFGTFRLVLGLRVFPRMQASHGAALLTRIVDRVFYLALTALILGVGAYLLVKLYFRGPTDEPFPTELAENGLKAYYARDAAGLYALLPDSAKAIFPNVTTVEAQVRRETFQVMDPPKFRTLQSGEVSGTTGLGIFKAEFDGVSIWQERVSVARVGGVWKLWNVDALPSDWPPANTVYLLPYTSLAAFEEAALAKTQTPAVSEILQRWVPPPGWDLVVDETVGAGGERTCDIKGRGRKATYLLHAVLGGCRLVAGQHIVVFGRVTSIIRDESRIELSTIRFYPPLQ